MSKNFIGYEYKEIIVDKSNVSMYLDAYKSFGWVQDDNIPNVQNVQTVNSIRLKRDRKIINKAELTRLQHQFEACMNEISKLEKSKTTKAISISLAIGLVGTIFMALSVFSITGNPSNVILCAIFGVLGFIGWGLAPIMYKKLVIKRLEVVNPLIEQKYDEIYTICEKGNNLL